jgi:hypothetical protein
MKRGFGLAAAVVSPVLLAAFASCHTAWAQNLAASAAVSTQTLPDEPQPGMQQPSAPQPATPQTDSSSQASQGVQQPTVEHPAGPKSPTGEQESDREKAQKQIKQQEKQRVLGILPMFNTSYVSDAVSLTAGEKIKLAFRTVIDPVSFAGPAIVAGIGELSTSNNNDGFGWGPDGYAKRWGAAYLDSFNGTMIGNGFLPALLRQDPRYFRLGRGSAMKRMGYSIASVAICKHDKTGRWEPNYSNVGGNLIAGALSNLYYPASPDHGGWAQTFTSGIVVTAEGGIGSMFQEFWPDISRKLFKKDPTHGRDAQMRAAQASADKAKQPVTPSPK